MANESHPTKPMRRSSGHLSDHAGSRMLLAFTATGIRGAGCGWRTVGPRPASGQSVDMTRTDRPASLFDRWSVRYDRRGLQLLTYRPVHDAVLARLNHIEPSMVVDLGCGTGQLTQRLARTFPAATIVGVDLSDGMLTQAASRLAAAGNDAQGLMRADAEQLPFAGSSVDVVVCTESFHWYRDQARSLNEPAGVLRPGGRLLIASIATITSLGDRLLRGATAASGSAIRALPPHHLRWLLSRAGFEVIYQHRIPRLGPIAWPVLTDARRR